MDGWDARGCFSAGKRTHGGDGWMPKYLLRYLDERLGWHDVDWLPTYFTYLATAWMVVCGMEV